MGKGYAIRTGFRKATGERVIFIDSDLNVDASQLKQYSDALRRADVVIGSKCHPDSVVSMPWRRKIAGRGFNRLVQHLTGLKVRDSQTGLKGVRKTPVTEHIFSEMTIDRYAFDVELLVLADLYGLRIAELPVRIRMKEMFRASAALRMFVDVLRIAFKLRRSGYGPMAPRDPVQTFRGELGIGTESPGKADI
jgi:glycosyltransferase involved in cell wall biosynthesis